MSIRFKIFIPVLILLILLPLASWLIFSFTSEHYMRSLAEQELGALLKETSAISDEIFQESEAGSKSILTEEEIRDLEKNQSKEFMSSMKTLLKKNKNQASMMVLNTKLKQIYPKESSEQREIQEIYYYIKYILETEGVIDNGGVRTAEINGRRYLVSLEERESKSNIRAKYLAAYVPILDDKIMLSNAGRLVFCITAFLAVASIMSVWWIAVSISKPLNHLCIHAAKIGRGSFEMLEDDFTIKEIDSLKTAVNHMAEQLESADNAQKTFFQNASHELRTPLMSIAGYAQGIQCGIFPDNENAAKIIVAESLRLKELVDGILSISRMDNQRQELNITVFCLNDFIEDSLEQLMGLALSENVTIKFERPQNEFYVKADAALLSGALYNVAANGIRYADHVLLVEIHSREGLAFITVSDDGPGIGKQDVDHIFQRFYKGRDGKFGIGLAIARSSMEYMNGDISAENSEHGAVFTLSVPVADKIDLKG